METSVVRRRQDGFTLIEIIAVLVILGILAAVAVPRYVSMQADAERAAAQSVVAELNARVGMAFAKNTLTNTANRYTGFSITMPGWTVAGAANDTPATATITKDGSSTGFTSTWVAGTGDSPGYFQAIATPAS